MANKVSQQLAVRVLKYDGSDYRQWSGAITRRDGPLIELNAEFSMDAYHPLLGEIPRGTRLIEYYWLDRWYNVLKFLNGDESTKHFYCNVTTPPKLDNHVLTYVDLDIDILALPDLSFQVLDEDEFETNAKRYGYSEEDKLQARAAVEELIAMIEQRHFPFVLDSSSVASVVN